MSEIKTTRAIKVGLYIKESESMKRLVSSHDFFNFCVKYYTQLLLEMRGGDVYLRDPKTGEETLVKASEYQEALCNRMKEASRRNGYDKELEPDEVEEFKDWCQEYYKNTIESANPKGRVNLLQNSEIKVETSGGRPSRLVCQTRSLIGENPDLLLNCSAPKEVCKAGENVNSKANAESVAEWIYNNQSLCIGHCPAGKTRIDAIVEEYPKEQQKKQESKKKKASDAASFGMEGIRVLPLIRKPAACFVTGPEPNKEIRNISPWYYGAWTIAVQRMKSWSTWNQNARDNYSETQARIEEKNKELDNLSDDAKRFIAFVLKPYEAKKDAEIRLNSEEYEYSGTYRILGRELRGLDIVLGKLIQAGSYDERINALNQLQDERKSEIGDINFYRFLAEDERWTFVKDSKTCIEAASAYKNVNKLKAKLDHIKDHAAFTMCDENLSPAWTQYEAGGGSGSNCPGYSLNLAENKLSLSLVKIGEESLSVSTDNSFLIGHSDQLKCLSFSDGKYSYRDPGTGRIFDSVKIGGGKLQFDRGILECKSDWRNKDRVKAYFNISLEINDKTDSIPSELICMNNDKESLGLFFSGDEKKKIFASKGKIPQETTLRDYVSKRPIRVMSVDLGLRVTYSYSVMEIVAEKGTGFCYEMRDFLTGDKLYALHERSGQIRLIGDKPSHLVELKRKELDDAAEYIRYRIDAIRYFRRLANCKQSDRKEEVEKLLNRYSQSRKGWPYKGDTHSCDSLKSVTEKFLNLPDDKWTEFIDATAYSMKLKLSEDFKKWSDNVRQPRNFIDTDNCQVVGLAGKSIWNIAYLTKVLNIMKKWHTLAEKTSVRSGLEKGEVFARELKEKINNLKELRQKETSDALIMTALGYVWVAGKSKNRLVRIVENNVDRFIPEQEYLDNRLKYTLYATGKEKYKAKDGFWLKLHEPCDFIVFEELQNYRTDDEKPSRENSMLMSWAHRSTVDQVRMQGELFGLRVGAVGASFSSRFHAASGCPGVRGNLYEKNQIREAHDELMIYLVQPENNRRKSSLSHLSRLLLDMYGDDVLDTAWKFVDECDRKGKSSDFAVLLPDRGGEYFIYGHKDPSGEIIPSYINADVNAAQNLAKRWITRYDNPQKINVSIVDGNMLPVDNRSVRINRIIGAACILADGKPDEKWFSGILEKEQEKKKKATKDESIETEEDDEELGKCSVFRDLSGTFFDPDRWYSSLQFWTTVRSRISQLISEQPIIVRIR